VAKKGTSFLGIALFIIIFAIVLLLGCSVPEITPGEQVIPEESELAYSVSISAPSIQMSGGILHWHKQLPNNTYTLENAAIEIYNFGDFDILVTQIEMWVDGKSKLFTVEAVIPAMTRETINVQPMIEGYNGSTHTIYITLLGENDKPIYQSDKYEIGPLEPTPGTGSWQQA